MIPLNNLNANTSLIIKKTLLAVLTFLFIISIYSCKSTPQEKDKTIASFDSSKIESIKTAPQKPKNQPAFIQDTTTFENQNHIFSLNTKELILSFKTGNKIYLIDTLDSKKFLRYEIINNNLWKILFIRCAGSGDEGDMTFIFLIDKKNTLFNKISNGNLSYFSHFNILDKEKGIYFDFMPSGCTWQNWDSRLFTIEKGKINTLGFIDYNNCEDTNFRLKVYRSKILKQNLVYDINTKEHPLAKTFIESEFIDFLPKFWTDSIGLFIKK